MVGQLMNGPKWFSGLQASHLKYDRNFQWERKKDAVPYKTEQQKTLQKSSMLETHFSCRLGHSDNTVKWFDSNSSSQIWEREGGRENGGGGMNGCRQGQAVFAFEVVNPGRLPFELIL